MRKSVILDVVGLNAKLLGKATPNLSRLAAAGAKWPIRTILPAVTCAVQSTFTTGSLPRDHGCVANGWYDRELNEVLFWKQSNALVHGEKIWDSAKTIDASFTCAKLFWWYNMYGTADVSVTPRPMYPADGRKVPDVYTEPASLRDELTRRFGTFPLFNFWGPTANITSSRWIAEATSYVMEKYDPTMTLVYLPHLDYNLQRLGPDDPALREDLLAVDAICGELIDQAHRRDASVVVLSEYSITSVNHAVHINRILRQAGFLRVREELGREILDPGASKAFAVADHQIAHVYVRDRHLMAEVRDLLQSVAGIEQVLDEDGKRLAGLDHPRSGDLIAVAANGSWFTYYFWTDEEKAPDYARTVDIHRKPGYDPVELFLDPELRMQKLQIGWKLMKKKAGFRTLFDVIPLRPDLVRGSHGRVTSIDEAPLLISSDREFFAGDVVDATDIKRLILGIFSRSGSASAIRQVPFARQTAMRGAEGR